MSNSKEQVNITFAGETVHMTWDGTQASQTIYVDGEATQYQTADARHRTSEAVRLVCRVVWGDKSRLINFDADSEEWDAVEYESV